MMYLIVMKMTQQQISESNPPGVAQWRPGTKVVALWSGGIDSTTLVASFLNAGCEVFPVNFDYGQKHKRELRLSDRDAQPSFRGNNNLHHTITAKINVPLRSALTDSIIDVPHGLYDEESQKQTVVPNRNMMLLSMATAYAISIGASVVAYGAHKSDYAIYPDCRPRFVKDLQQAIFSGNYETIFLTAPFLEYTKKDIVCLGLSMNLDYSRTWSCYHGARRPCLQCGTCTERTEAFLANGVRDPALYKTEWKKAVEIYRKFKNETTITGTYTDNTKNMELKF